MILLTEFIYFNLFRIFKVLKKSRGHAILINTNNMYMYDPADWTKL